MFNNPTNELERVKTPLPEQLKNSFSFANQQLHQVSSNNEDEEIEEEVLEENAHNTIETANLDVFNHSAVLTEGEQNEINTLDNIATSRRNRLDGGGNNENDIEDDNTIKKKKKRVKKKRTKKLVEEEPEIHEEEEQENIAERSEKNDLFAVMKRNHYLTISPNDIITKEKTEGEEEPVDLPMETSRKPLGPMSQRQKTLFIESKYF